MEIIKEQIQKKIEDLRKEIGHEEAEVNIKDIIYIKAEEKLIIITPDRPDKSAVIGKGGWVVGRLKESLGVKNIHVAAYSDIMVKEYRMKLALKKLNKFLSPDILQDPLPLHNLKKLLLKKMENPYDFNFMEYFNLKDYPYNDFSDVKTNQHTLVALSGGVDSSFSLIIAHLLGFNPLALTVDPGSIVLPKHLKNNIDSLCHLLKVPQVYVPADFTEIINDSFQGRFHPCGKCSKVIHEKIRDYAQKNNIKIVIFGDLLSTGCQSILSSDGIIRINLPALLGVSKQELKGVSYHFGVKKVTGFGCPLLGEVEKKFPHMSRYSIQRVLRETRAGALEPGEALELIWSSCKHFK
ncbi:MAG: ATPase [Euryarchaeota archaeon]|nr:ATPase [Euryarchaeota archaeon]MBU4607173.1 ATPase [Euryarchaeota archaeon]MBV1729355.1 ATPase [Methanobacterium sp.]MBV1754276.1 ATPase [Methanobacterium sp.]